MPIGSVRGMHQKSFNVINEVISSLAWSDALNEVHRLNHVSLYQEIYEAISSISLVRGIE